MATLFEQSANYNTRCFACGSLVYAVEKKLTTNHVNVCFSILYNIEKKSFFIGLS